MSPAISVAVDDDAVELLLHFARAAHHAGGYPANELEPRIIELAHALGLKSVEVAATPTALELTVGTIPNQHAYVLRVHPRPVNLHAIDQLEEISDAVAHGRLDPRHALDEIEELGRHPINRPAWLVLGAHGLVGAALTPLLGGGWHESVGAAVVGLAVGLLIRAVRGDRLSGLLAPIGACLASFLACAIALAGFDMAVTKVTFAALIVLFPGMAMVIGVRELATQHLQAGIANSVNALMQLTGLVFGVAVGRSLAAVWLGAIPVNTPPDPFPQFVGLGAAALVGLAFVVTLRAPVRDALWICGGAVLASIANVVATDFMGRIAGVFTAAFVVGIAGNALARRFRRSPLPFIVPGSLLLVPGNVGFEGAARLLAGQTVSGIDTAIGVIATLIAIAYGLVASTLVLPDQPASADATG